MANAKGKAVVVPPTFADRFVALLWSFVTAASASASRSISAMQLLTEMHKALPADKFLPEIHALCGNGHAKTKERTQGSVIAAIDTKVKSETAQGHTVAIPPGLRTFASMVRKVAENISMPEMDKAMLRGTDAAYAYATGKTDANGTKVKKAEGETATPKTATPKADPKALDTYVLEAIAADLDHVLAMCESFLVAKADPIRSGAIHDARIKVKASA